MQPEEVIRLLDSVIDEALLNFNKSFADINPEILSELTDFSSNLKRTAGGNIKASVENLKTLTKYNSRLDVVLKKSGYNQSVSKLINSIYRIQDISNEYFSSLSDSFNNKNILYKEILNQNIATTTESLLGAGINAEFKQPIIKILRNSITGQSSTGALREQLSEAIMGSKDKKYLMRWTSQVANDSVMQFERNYMQVISGDLNLNHYLYAGTRISDTRPFCVSKVGKYFTDAEVKAWAHLSWAGKIPETNEFNIKTYLGGYNCRHRLLPVSKDLYDLKTNK